jgi:hypothetical protein
VLNFIPKKFFVTSGGGQDKESALNAFSHSSAQRGYGYVSTTRAIAKASMSSFSSTSAFLQTSIL